MRIGMRIVCYVSGHGFGHASRVCEVLRELRRRRPDVAIAVRSPVPRWFFELSLGGDFSHADCRLDVGAVQADSLAVDIDATAAAYAAIEARRAALITAETAALSASRPRLLLADIPALAFDIAAALAIPGIAVTNFSWDWIYADYAAERPAFAPLVAALRRSYGRASLLCRLPLHGDLSAFPRVRDVPLVARRATLDRDHVRARLDLPRQRRLVLLSFGGIGLSLDALPSLDGVGFVSTAGAAVGGGGPRGCRVLAHDELGRAGVRYEDLVGAVDAVLTKPGYGIVAECIANRTAIVYTARGRFAEYDCLVAGIEAHLANAFIDPADLRAGRWRAALDQAWAMPMPPPIPIDGAAVVAEQLDQLFEA
ncbi:MAG TPA: hypothetical protein VL049_01985 [Candidatus Dormibacteraeota bacterium]|nr:hypothetical protein [Candidatus Dormibacteraeota bacterium]